MPTKAYLRKRKLRNPLRGKLAVVEVISDWDTLRVSSALGVKFKRTTRVVLRRPAWMPGRVYTWLLSTVVSEPEAPKEA